MTPRETLQQIQEWVKENPHRKRSVIPIEIRVDSDTKEGAADMPAAAVGGLVPIPLEPPGPVALVLWNTLPEFRAGTAQVRRTILRDKLLEIQVRAEAELRGVRWSRKKVIEQLSAQQTAAVSPPMETPELDAALAHLFGYQKVVVDEAGRKIRFFPADVRTWSAETPIWGATTGARAVLHHPGEVSIGSGLGRWLQAREDDGWKVDWPEATGTLEEIKQRMESMQLQGPRIVFQGNAKPKKADWAAALGRAEAIAHLATVAAAAAAAPL
jgi:hypothetical protein